MSSNRERSGRANGSQHLVDESLAERIQERIEKGLSPPPEIYQVQNRGKIDWSQLPEWAQPLDPEVFEGCGHEG